MYLKTLKGLNSLIKETDYYKDKLKETDKKLTIDKINMVLNNIINGNRNNWYIHYFEPIPLSHQILKEQLGRNYKEFIDLLISINIIETDNKYLTTSTANKLSRQTNYNVNPQSKKYGLTAIAKQMEIVNAGVLTKRIEKKILETKANELNQYLKNNLHSKIIKNLTNLTFTINDLDNALALVELNEQTEIDHYTDCFNALHNLNGIASVNDLKKSLDFFYNANNKVGRVYHYYTTIPKQYRKHLRHSDGSKLLELDMKNSQPLILMLLFYQSVTHFKNGTLPTNTNKKFNNSILQWFEANKIDLINTIAPTNKEFIELTKELDKLFDDMVSGTFYQTIKINANLLNISVENDYKSLKINVLKCVFSYANDKLTDLEIVINKVYPYFLKFIRLIKTQRNNKELSHLAQIYESSIFIDKVFTQLDNDVFAIPVHDSIIVKENDLYKVKRIILDAITDTFKIDESIAFRLIKTSQYE